MCVSWFNLGHLGAIFLRLSWPLLKLFREGWTSKTFIFPELFEVFALVPSSLQLRLSCYILRHFVFIFGSFGVNMALSWTLLGPTWGPLGPSWGLPGHSWNLRGATLGPSWLILGPSWVTLGPPLRPHGPPRSFLGAPVAYLGLTWFRWGLSWGLLVAFQVNVGVILGPSLKAFFPILVPRAQLFRVPLDP